MEHLPQVPLEVDRGAFFIDCVGGNNSGTGKSSLACVIADTLADPFFITEFAGAKLDKSAGARLRKLRRRRMGRWRAEPPRRELLSIWQARQQIDLLREGGQDLEDGDAGTFCPC